MKSYIPFDYIAILTLAANGQATVALQIQQDADFELHNILGVSSKDAATDNHSNNFTVLWKDSSTGRQFSNAPVPQSAFGGPSNGSIREFRPIVLSKSTQMEFSATDISGFANVVTIILKGYKVFGA